MKPGLVKVTLAVWIACFILPAAPAMAACQYKGVLYAEPGLAEEFNDSIWVAHVRVEAATHHYEDEGDSYSIYRLGVLRSFKGDAPQHFEYFTFRNSGGFYFDIPWVGTDLGGEYLAFLNPIPPYAGRSPAEEGKVAINYACGHSKVWRDVMPADLDTLERLRLQGLSRPLRK